MSLPPAPSPKRLSTRARLLDAAAVVFAELGVQAASVEAVCTRADFTRGAFYSNFSSKEELFLALLEREFAERMRVLKQRAAELTPVLQERGGELSASEAASIIAEFFLPTEHATTWFFLETEFLLLAMRDREIAPKHHALMEEMQTRLASAVADILRAAGREPRLPSLSLLKILTSEYDQALQVTALVGPDAPGGVNSLGTHLAELLFVLTRKAPEAS